MNRRVLTLCCIFLLLFAQHAALAHALWHAHPASPQQPAADCNDSCSSERPAQPDRGKLCGFDLVFSQVLGAAAGATVPMPLDASCATVTPAHRELVFTARFIAPLSRGPPTLL